MTIVGWHLIDIAELIGEATLSGNAGAYVKPFPMIKVKNKDGTEEEDATGLLRPAMVAGVENNNNRWQTKLWGF